MQVRPLSFIFILPFPLCFPSFLPLASFPLSSAMLFNALWLLNSLPHNIPSRFRPFSFIISLQLLLHLLTRLISASGLSKTNPFLIPSVSLLLTIVLFPSLASQPCHRPFNSFSPFIFLSFKLPPLITSFVPHFPSNSFIHKGFSTVLRSFKLPSSLSAPFSSVSTP